MHSHNSWDLKSLNKRSLVLCFKKLEDRHFPPLSYFDFRNKIQTSSLDLVKTLNRYLKIWLVIVYWVERSFFFYLIFKISVSTHFQMPCAVETFIYFHLKFTKGKCTRGHIYKTKKTKQLLTLGLPLMNTLQIEGLFRSLKLTFMSILSSGPSAWDHSASLGLRVLFCKYQFFSKLGKFLRKKNKTSNLFTEQNEIYCCRFRSILMGKF